jgi:hypothetical protein
MAGPVNDIAKLLDKIERRLGLTTLVPHLPKEFGKDAWASVIEDDTLVTFSRYFPILLPLFAHSRCFYFFFKYTFFF